MRSRDLAVAVLATAAAVFAACGGSNPVVTPIATPTPISTPTPTPTPSQPAVPKACQLTAPTVDCAARTVKAQELAPVLQAGIDTAMSTSGVMYPDVPGRVYDLDRFRSLVVDRLAAEGVCGAWDYGNNFGDEIYVRSADGCVIEQYDLITGEGMVRPAGKASNAWQEGWGVEVPAPKPQYPRYGDLSCSLEGDHETFCFAIKFSPGFFGDHVYRLLKETIEQNPGLFDTGDTTGATQFEPDLLKMPGWRIQDLDGYIAALLAKLRANGYCAFVEKGDILKVKQVSRGNVLHEEIDIVQNPGDGKSYLLFVVKDRCHNAGF